ncbi:hypothetical protein H6P81_008362 [Aristolochia fimbriata]|uniref:RING-type domain-containing protein n=1 Tax=Aristolochia fimbriata TaxID=158543 RepID=A0AAV7F361_ARIFI|nr:hypothetical protein H6P81_008362 [Aristolochia fimbriata]
MGFPSICYGVIMPKPLVELADLWNHIKLMVRLAFFYLGLFDPTDVSANWEDHGLRRSTVDVQPSSVSITPQEIKKSLPIVQFADFLRWSGAGDSEEEAPVCAVCLCNLEGRHQIRELGSCSHVFHLGCLDKWVDLGQTNSVDAIQQTRITWDHMASCPAICSKQETDQSLISEKRTGFIKRGRRHFTSIFQFRWLNSDACDDNALKPVLGWVLPSAPTARTVCHYS